MEHRLFCDVLLWSILFKMQLNVKGLNSMCFALAFKHIMLYFMLLSMVINTYVLFLHQLFLMYLCLYIFTFVLISAIEHV